MQLGPQEVGSFDHGLVTRKEFVVPEALNFGNGKRLKVSISAQLIDEPPNVGSPSAIRKDGAGQA